MGNLFKPKQPKLPDPTPMPDPEDPAVLAARRQQIDEMKRRGGRESTIMSDSLVGASGKLGQ